MPLPASGAISLNQVQTEFGGSNPISMSEYYGVGGSNVEPLGLSGALFTVSGNNGSLWTTRVIDISNFEGHSVRPVFLHTNMSAFTSDLQLDQIGFGSSLESFESGTTGWTTTVKSTQSYTTATFQALNTGGLTGAWNRDSGGTPSSGTGNSSALNGSWYVYTETTSYFTSTQKYYLRKTSPVTITSNNNQFTFAEARNGAGMGTLTAYLEVISQPSATGTPASGTISLSDFYGLSAVQVATAVMTPAYDGSLESTYTYMTNDRRGFGVVGKNDFYFPESVGTTYDDAFGSLTNASGLISGAGVTSISAVDVTTGTNDHVILQAQGAGLNKSSISYMKLSGYLPATGQNTSVTLYSNDSRVFFGTPARLNNNGVINMNQWVWLNSTSVPEGSINNAVSMIHHAAANGLNVTIEMA